MDDVCETLSKGEKNKSFSAQKKKKKTFKSVLLPSKTPQHEGIAFASAELKELLRKKLPLACITEPETDKEAHREARSTLALGVNAVYKTVKKKNISGVLYASDVNPITLISHVVEACHNHGVPILKVSNDFRQLTKDTLGFECIALGFKKLSVTFEDVIQMLCQEANVQEDLVTEVKEINLEKTEDSVIVLEETPAERVFSYFKRLDGNSRVFSPEEYNKQHGLVNEPIKSDKDFISIDNQSFILDENEPKGISTPLIKDAGKRKKKFEQPPPKKVKNDLNNFKKKKRFLPARVQKIGSNVDRGKNKLKPNKT